MGADQPTAGRTPAPSAALAEPAGGRRPPWRRRVSDALRTIRANRTGRVTLKVTVAVVGALVVAIGIVLIPLPGPGWALVLLGLAIWAIEFVWAKHLLRLTRSYLQRWTRWVASRSWPVRIALGFVGLIFVGAVVWLSLKYSFGIDLAARVWTYVTTH